MPEINPVTAFRPNIQAIINHYSEMRGYPPEYFMTAMLAAVSIAAGRSVVLNTGNYQAIGIIWAAIVGKPGLVKSPSQKDALKPLMDRQFEIFNTHNSAAIELEEVKKSNPKNAITLPDPEKIILSDATPEALSVTLANNPRGCGIIYDELSGFISRFNRYNGGGDEEMYLSLFNGDTILRTRINGTGNAAVKNSFLSIVGTIQPAILNKVFSEKKDNGFFDRWLICNPQGVTKKYPSFNGVDPVIEGRYAYIINNLLAINFNAHSTHEMIYSPESYKVIFDYQCKLIDIQNNTENDQERSILAKFEIYLHRFALLLQLLQYADIKEFSDPSLINQVSIESANGAILLTEYFLSQAKLIRVINPLDNLTDIWKEVFRQLPSHGLPFSRLQFIKKCGQFQLGESIADKFLKNNSDRSEEKLLFKISQGNYTKNLF
jgi:hypothetical protein